MAAPLRRFTHHAQRSRCRFVESDSAKHRAALVRAMVLAAAADGEVSDEEEGFLREGLATLTQFARLGNEELERLITDALERLQAEGPEETIVLLAEALPTAAARREAFTIAALVTLADGRLARDEHEVLDLLATGLGIPEGQARAILGELMLTEGVD